MSFTRFNKKCSHQIPSFIHVTGKERTQKLTIKNANKNKNKYLGDIYIYKKALVCI